MNAFSGWREARPEDLTAERAADTLGKASTSAAVEHVLSQPDPWGALQDRVEWQKEPEYEAGS